MAYISDFERHEDGRLYGKETRLDELLEPEDVILSSRTYSMHTGYSTPAAL